MPKMTKLASGLILFDDFSVNNLIWNLSPSNYNNVEFNNGLRIFHNKKYTTLSILEPDRAYSFICKLNHTPVDKTDIGGVIVMSNTTSYAECQSYMAEEPSSYNNSDRTEQVIRDYIDEKLKDYVQYDVDDDTVAEPDSGTGTTVPSEPTSGDPTFVDTLYPYIKFNKQGDLYSFFASKDGSEWIEIGNTEIPDSNRIGFFLYGVNDDVISNGSFVVQYVAMYNNNYVVFENIKTDQTIELRRKDGTVLCDINSPFVARKSNKILIDTTNMIMPIEDIRFIALQDGQIIYEYEIPKLFGGDSYAYGYNLKIAVNNEEIDQEKLFYLGEFNHNDQTVKIDIYNNEDYKLTNLKVSIASYSVYHGGEEVIGISLYDENQKDYNFTKSVVIPAINPTEGKSVLIKLTDRMIQDFYKVAGSYRFKINIE